MPARLLAMATIWGEHLFAQSYVSLATMLESSKIATKCENGTGFATIKYINWPKFTQLMHTQTHQLLNPACTYVYGVISDPLSKNTAHPTKLILNLSLLDRSFSSWTQIVTPMCYRGVCTASQSPALLELTGRSVKYGNALLGQLSTHFSKNAISPSSQSVYSCLSVYKHNVSPHFHDCCLSQLSFPTVFPNFQTAFLQEHVNFLLR